MTQKLWWIFAFNLIVNSFLTFLTIAFFIILVIFIFRIKYHRLITLLLCIPFLKLLMDPFFYTFKNWALFHNKKLVQKLKQTRCRLIISSYVNTPCAFGFFQKWICFPNTLMQSLTQKEFEIIIAHELGHLRWYDGVTRLICHCISHLFWWIPLSWWLKNIENMQERACDAIINEFDMSKVDLASALLKAAKATNQQTHTAFSTFFVLKNSFAKRIKYLIENSRKENSLLQWISIPIATMMLISFFFGKFWIF